jgi:arginase
MDLAIVCGIGPRGLIDLAGPPPLANPADIAVLGFRDEADAAHHRSPDPRRLAPEMKLVDAAALRRMGAGTIGRSAASRFARKPGRFWLHFDLDVLDEKEQPAVDYRMPGGLTWRQAGSLLKPLIASPACIGMDVTILNPDLDPTGKHVKRTVEFLARLLGGKA